MSLMLIMMWVFFGLIFSMTMVIAGPRLGRLLRKAARGCGYFAETSSNNQPAGRA